MKSSAQIWVALGVAISLFGTVCGLSAIINHRSSNDTVEISRSRTERSLMFPYNSALGVGDQKKWRLCDWVANDFFWGFVFRQLIVAIAVPLKVPDRNIFMSYNFEGNYNSPQSTNVFTEGFFNWVRRFVEDHENGHDVGVRLLGRFVELPQFWKLQLLRLTERWTEIRKLSLLSLQR